MAKTKMKKIKSFKKLGSLRKREWLKIAEGVEIPIKSLNLFEEIEMEDDEIKPPVKEVKCTQEEIEEFAKENPDVKKIYLKNLKKKVFDYTDEEYLKKVKEHNVIKNINQALRYIDLDYPTEDGKKLWEDMGLKSNKDIDGLREFLFNELELGTDFYKKLRIAIEAVRDEPVVSKLLELENMFGGESGISILSKVMEMLDGMNDGKENKES